ncbi:MAG: glycosyltransferase family 39 protein [Opitutaceae bacterium]
MADFFYGLAGLAIMILPGWLVARAARVRQALLGGFVATPVLIVSLLLLLNACGVAFSFAHCALAWLSVTVVSAVAAWPTFRSSPRPDHGASFAWREHSPLFLPLIPILAVVIYRAASQPLFGYDTIFRWNYLAQQMFTRGNLGFYPPVTGADYAIYDWPDGIAPAVSSLYFWLYRLAGATRATLTAPLVVGQFCLLLAGGFALARRLFSDRAAVFTCALLACSPVVAWATAMGQETGLIALALIALLFYLPRTRAEATDGSMLFAGLAAGLGGLAREYGLALILLGLGLALIRRLSVRSLAIFCGAALVTVLPWYARNWIRTGNPLFNLEVAGWFPVNQVHAWLNQSYQVAFGWSNLPPNALRFVLINCCVALLGTLAGGALYYRKARPLLGAIGLIVALWALSLGYTAAGFTVAVRVLSPAVVLGCVLGGAACARWVPTRKHLTGATLALGLLAVDAALRALTLPGTVYKIPPADWLASGRAMAEYNQRPAYRQIAQLAGTERILVLGPNALLNVQGAHTLPLWSPEVSFLFDDRLRPAEIARRLRAANIGYVLLTRGAPNEKFLAHSAYFREPGDTLFALWSDETMILLRVAGLKPPAPAA